MPAPANATSRDLEAFEAYYARTLFPAFEAPLPSELAFFDNAGGTFPCGAAINALTRFLTQNKVQPYGPNALAETAGDQMDLGRRTLSDLLDVDPETLTIGPSTTQNLNTLAHACRPLLGPNTEIVISGQEHEANIGCWERLAKRTDSTLRWWPVERQTGELSLETLETLLSSRTRLVCVTHSSNIIGSINPISDIADRVHQAGARLVVDGVSYAPHRWPEIEKTGADAYAFSTYKTFATHLGVLWTKPDFLDELEPQCHFFNEKKRPSRLDSAGPIHASIAALAGLGDFFQHLHEHHFSDSADSLHQMALDVSSLSNAHESMLCDRLLSGLADLPVRIWGKTSTTGREANVSITSGKSTSLEINRRLGDRHIAAKNGHFYAARLIDALGIENRDDGVVRFSLSMYNTLEEVERLLETLTGILKAR